MQICRGSRASSLSMQRILTCFRSDFCFKENLAKGVFMVIFLLYIFIGTNKIAVQDESSLQFFFNVVNLCIPWVIQANKSFTESHRGNFPGLEYHGQVLIYKNEYGFSNYITRSSFKTHILLKSIIYSWFAKVDLNNQWNHYKYKRIF